MLMCQAAQVKATKPLLWTALCIEMRQQLQMPALCPEICQQLQIAVLCLWIRHWVPMTPQQLSCVVQMTVF
jgi:hypothetical protein